MVKQPTIVNATSHKPTIILLILNLVATLALLAHVVYYIPSSTSAAAATNSNPEARIGDNLESNGVGTIGLDNTNRVQFDLIKVSDEGGVPQVLQTVTVTQQDFLNSFERFLAFREALEEKDLIRRNDE